MIKGKFSDGSEFEMEMSDVFQTIYDMTKLVYFDYMISIDKINFDDFRSIYCDIIKELLNKVHSKYADHIEGIRNQFIEREGA